MVAWSMRSFADEEDILVSVFDRFFRAANENRFARLEDRDDLWQILLMLTERKIVDVHRWSAAQKRQGKWTQPDYVAATSERFDIADPSPSPEFIAEFNDNLARALERLDEGATREVALLRMEGYEDREIANRLSVSLSTVERKLRVIRKVWQEAIGNSDST
jgi:DNA-directed RNA polymerase specialized sigma24 family protein